MKKTVLMILLLIISSANVPTSAQKSQILNTNVRFRTNPVSYASLNAFSDGSGVWLEWKTEIESRNLGFFVYQIDGVEKELVSPNLIAGAYLQARDEKITNGNYSFFDRFGDVNSIYVIESVNLNGQRHNSNQIQTRLIDDLEFVAGVSSAQLINQSKNAKPVFLRNDSILPEDLAAETAENALPADPIKQRWVAAQRGVKIGVKNENFYRVARADLQNNNFDVTAPSGLWQLYVNGVEQAINVVNDGEYVEFYGKGIDTPESDTQTYFLIVGTQNGKRIGDSFRRRVSGSVISNSYLQTFYKKERKTYTQSFLNGDVENFFGTFINNNPAIVNFDLNGVDFNSAAASIDIALQGGTLITHRTKVTINNVEIGEINGSNYELTSKLFEVPTSALREGANSIKFQTLDNASDISFFSSLKVNYARHYRAEQNKISFYVPNYKAVYVENFTSPNIRVFDTTNPDAPALIGGLTVEQNGGSFRVFLPSNRGRVLYAVEDSGISQVFSITPNKPSTLSTAANDGDLIIISYKNWLAQAENWANYRRAQGMSVKVVNVEDIFDEFNYGVINADSIRSFLNYAKNNWTTAPKYVLLLGDATFDPKNYLGGSDNNFVPTRLIDTLYTETGSDDTLADFDNDGLAELAIGRIPAANPETVTLALNKVIAFEQNVAQGINRGAIFASDLPNGYDFEGLSNRLRDQLPNAIPRIMINRAAPDAQTQLLAEINNGRFLVNYSGHGNIGIWATNGFFNNSNAAQLTNSNNKLSIFTMLTCLNGYFIQPTDSLSEVLLKNPNGGAAATWSSTGLTTPDIQEIMATRFYNQIGAGNITRLGDLINDAKTTINFGRDVRLSWVLLGDPTLKVK